jgi:hypothetical protein
MAARIFATNDARYGYAYHEEVVTYGVGGNITADSTGVPLVVPPGKSGTIVAVHLAVGTNVEDGTDAASLAAQCAINGTSVFTTAGAIAKAAGTGAKNTFAAGTGITLPVLDATKVTLAAGDVVTAGLDVTRTTPETEFANAAVVIVIRWDAAA